MEGFKAALINEIEKLYKKKKILVAVIISLIFIILGQLSIVVLRNGFGLMGVSGSNFPLLILSIVANTILPLFTALVTIDSFSGEFSHNIMKIVLTKPITRFKFFAAKLIAIMLFILANLLFVMIFSIIVGLIFNFNSFIFKDIIKIIISYFVTLMPMMVLSLIIILFTNIIKSSIGVFFISIFIFIIFKALELILYKYSGLFFTSMLNWYSLWIMDNIPVYKVLRQFILMLSYDILLFTGSYYLFDKKDF